MTPLGHIISFYPVFILALWAVTFFWFVSDPSPVQPLLIIAIIYLLPPVTFRIHNYFFPMRERMSNLSERRYSPWWGAHMIQVIYIAIPQLESLIRLVPGLYSAWLRLWGSRVGRKVYWTPNVEITDRQMLEIGDRVVVGHKTKLLGHAIKPRGDRIMLYAHTIKIGSDALIGAGSRIGPGAVIHDKSYIPVLTDVYVNQVFEAGDREE